MTLKSRLNALERPPNKELIDVEALQARYDRHSKPITPDEFTSLWRNLFDRAPNALALEETQKAYDEWAQAAITRGKHEF